MTDQKCRINVIPRQIAVWSHLRRLAPFILVVAVLAFAITYLTSAQFLYKLLADTGENEPFGDQSVAEKEGRPIAWWMKRALANEPAQPDIVVLGSSQLGGLRAADAAASGKQLDYTQDFRGYCLEQKLERAGSKKLHVFVAAVPGALVSDDCAISMAMFRRPAVKTLVIALAPRDFMPNGTRCPGDSPTFRFFFPQANFDAKIIELAYPHFLNRVSLLIDWYHNKKKSLVRDGMTDIKPGQYVFQPTDAQTYQEMSGQYPINVTTIENHEWFKNQLFILEHTLPCMAKGGTRIVIVNMPLRQKLRQQLSDETWARFSRRLRRLCATTGGSYIDLSRDQSFTQADFLDNLHLSSAGGMRLATLLSRSISELDARR